MERDLGHLAKDWLTAVVRCNEQPVAFFQPGGQPGAEQHSGIALDRMAFGQARLEGVPFDAGFDLLDSLKSLRLLARAGNALYLEASFKRRCARHAKRCRRLARDTGRV